jgi:small-conductance mechanosensitive channel
MEFSEELQGIWTNIDRILHYRLFDINQTEVTLATLLVFVLVIVGVFILSRILNRLILRRVLDRFQIERGIQYNMVRVGHYIVMAIGVIFALQFVGIDFSGLAVIFGFLSVGIGFGLQNITSNFVSGIILLFERPIKVGDRVTVADIEGDVTAINMRATTIRTLNNITIIVPNQEFVSASVINWSHGDTTVRMLVSVGVSYNSDLDTVIKALEEVADDHPRVLKDPKPDVVFRGFGDSAWDLDLRCWIAEPRGYYTIQSDLNCAIVRVFRKYNVEIPFPQRDLHVRSPLPVPLATENRLPREAMGD